MSSASIVKRCSESAREVNVLRVRPRMPKTWNVSSIRFRFRETLYRIQIERSTTEANVSSIDEAVEPERSLFPLLDDGREHAVLIRFNDSEKPPVLIERKVEPKAEPASLAVGE